MIVAFAVDPEALALPGRDPGVRLAAHERLLRWWTHLGILVYPGESFSSSPLRGAIKALPVDLRKRWEAAFQKGWHGAAPEVGDLSTMEDAEGLARMKGHVSLACVEEQRAVRMGLPIGRPARRVPKADVEICRLECIDATEAFERSNRLSDGFIDAGIEVAELWKVRFSRMARWAGRVVVVDRFGAAKQARERRRGGWARLLGELDAEGPGTRVQIYSQVTKDAPADKVVEALGETIGSMVWRGVREIRLTLLTEQYFWQVAHDRYIRFDDKVCTIGVGVYEVLQAEKVSRRTTFRLMPHSDQTRAIEKTLGETAILDRSWSAESRSAVCQMPGTATSPR